MCLLGLNMKKDIEELIEVCRGMTFCHKVQLLIFALGLSIYGRHIIRGVCIFPALLTIFTLSWVLDAPEIISAVPVTLAVGYMLLRHIVLGLQSLTKESE